MGLNFGILWIDDQPRHVKSFREGLENKLGDLGFELAVVEVSSLDKVGDATHVHQDGVDLVLVDYDLGTGAGGEAVLAEVKRRLHNKEIIFYSATDTENLRKLAYEAKVDGIHFSTRLSLVNDTIDVIDKLLRKVLDVDHMRGIVMSASSDIDFLVERCLIAVHGRMQAEDQANFRNDICKQLYDKLDRWKCELEKAAKKGTLEAILKLNYLCSAMDRMETLLDQLGKGWSNDGSSYLEQAQAYQKEVVPKRNKMAHGMLKREEGKTFIVGTEQPITETDMLELRKALIEHRSNFQQIAVLVDIQLN